MGLISLTIFVVVYAWVAGRARWLVCLVVGSIAFFAATAPLSTLRVSPVLALGFAFAAFVLALAILPHAPPPLPGEAARGLPAWDLPARATSAVVLVLLLTAAASALGPSLSGLLAPFPIITSILAAFAHAHGGLLPARRILRGLLLGYFAFALFCFTLAETLGTLGVAASFVLAALVALCAQAVATRFALTAGAQPASRC